MGNLCALLKPTHHQQSPSSSNKLPSTSRREKKRLDDASIREQAIAATLLYKHHQQNLQFDRSSSLRYPNGPSKKNHGTNTFPRSSSSRARSLTDPLLHPHQLLNQGVKVDDLETNHFILVHGGGFGAWCWYKTIALLEESGYKVSAIDLAGSGVHSFDTNNITSLFQYVKPLTDFLEKLPESQKVILVGHDFGGACISYAMELFLLKVSKAVFIAAAMPTNGQSTLDIISKQAGLNDLMPQAQISLYANGNNILRFHNPYHHH